MKKALYAGSFDPITNGHLWVIEQASKMFDHLTVLVTINPEKKHFFDSDQRLSVVKESCSHLKNVLVEFSSHQYTVSYCEDKDISYVVRGIRNTSDFEYEQSIAQVNRQISKKVESIFLVPPPELVHTSSSLVKGLISYPNWQSLVSKLVPSPVVTLFLKKMYREPIEDFIHYYLGYEFCAEVMNKLSEPHRYYHNGQHINEMLTQIKKVVKYCNLSQKELEILFSAAIYHDIIYDPHKKDNEELSSQLYENHKGKYPEVSDLILSTKSHLSTPRGNHLRDIFLDLDLSILAAPWERFKEYNNQIREEYSFVPEEMYNTERFKIIQSFFNEPNLFRSEYFINNGYEEKAKANLNKLLKENLKSKINEIK